LNRLVATPNVDLVDCSSAGVEKILDFVAHPVLSYLEVRFTHILNQVIDCRVHTKRVHPAMSATRFGTGSGLLLWLWTLRSKTTS
jgi:hypothetical protein